MLFNSRKRLERKRTDFGRTYGWNILKDSVLIGILEYDYFDIDSQFWHIYTVVCDTPDLYASDIDILYSAWDGAFLQNRMYTTFLTDNFIPAPRKLNSVAIRGLYLPDNFYTGKIDVNGQQGDSENGTARHH